MGEIGIKVNANEVVVATGHVNVEISDYGFELDLVEGVGHI